MIIQQATVQLQSRHSAVAQAAREERLTVRIGDPALRRAEQRDRLEVGDAVRRADDKEQKDDHLDPKLRVVKLLLERLTGKKVYVYPSDEPAQKDGTKQVQHPAGPDAQRRGWSVEYERRESYYEAERTSFSASGVVRTADGRELSFTIALGMSREYAVESAVSVRAGDVVDPLVINFGGTAAELTSTKFAFDLDSDGNDDSVSFLKPGSGFLALDRNGDGVVSNGSELFGSGTGNGFEELRAYDGDGNNWIDEKDDVYNALRIWARDHQGRDVLHTLKHRDVGALFLGSVRTPFAVTTADNERLGQVVSSGVFLRENGTAGTMQQVNLAI